MVWANNSSAPVWAEQPIVCLSQGALVCWPGTSWGSTLLSDSQACPLPWPGTIYDRPLPGKSVSGLSKENLIFLERQEDLKLTFLSFQDPFQTVHSKKITSFIYHWPVPSSSTHIIQLELYIHPGMHNWVFSFMGKSRLRKDTWLARGHTVYTLWSWGWDPALLNPKQELFLPCHSVHPLEAFITPVPGWLLRSSF